MLTIGKTELTAEQRLIRNHALIVANPTWTALSSVLSIGSKRVTDNEVPTAATNGRDEIYNREFVGTLTDPEFRFLIVHEAFHKMYRHLTIYKRMCDEDMETANQAMDYASNWRICKADAQSSSRGFLSMPSCGLLDERFADMDTPQIYQILRKEKQQQQSGQGQGQGQKMDSHDWEGASKLSDKEVKELAQEIDNAIRQGALHAGKTGSGGERLVADLLVPQVRWQDTLREYVSALVKGSDYGTWARPNRRYIAQGMYMPSSVSETVGEVVIATDTSGSISDSILRLFLSECASIFDTCKPDAVHMMYWDTRVCQYERYAADKVADIVRSTKPEGGGGTSVSCVSDFLSSRNINPKVVIVFTDGYLGGDYGNWTVPVIWCVLDNKSFNPPVGKVVHIKEQ
jgi:predicted metal-dependent peptidase